MATMATENRLRCMTTPDLVWALDEARDLMLLDAVTAIEAELAARRAGRPGPL